MPLTARWDVVREPKFVADTRARAQAALEAWGVTHGEDDVLLILSELVTNALCHGTGDIVVSLRLNRDEGLLTGTVDDGDTDWPRERQNKDHDDPAEDELGEGGRGLAIVAELAENWGVIRTAGRARKTVWFRCAVSSSHPEDAA